MTGTLTWAAMDVHARSTEACAVNAETGELRRAHFGAGTEPVVHWLTDLPQPVHACYEAGPTGYGLFRAAEAAGIRIEVVAPGKTPRAQGDRIKTDRKDAEHLVRQLIAGALSPIRVPSPAFEAARDLTRAREQLRGDLTRARHRVSKMLLRYGQVYPAKKTWSTRHREWLARQRFDEASSQLAYGDYLAAVDGLVARRRALDEQLSQLALSAEFLPLVSRLRAFRGIDTLTALALHLEIGEWGRFRRPAQLAAWLGLVPSVSQSGESASQGAITKTGSRNGRRLLVEAAWHYQRVPRVGLTLARRQEGQPAQILQASWRAQCRLHRQHKRLRVRGKPANVVTVACARELACFLWAAAVAP